MTTIPGTKSFFMEQIARNLSYKNEKSVEKNHFSKSKAAVQCGGLVDYVVQYGFF